MALSYFAGLGSVFFGLLFGISISDAVLGMIERRNRSLFAKASNARGRLLAKMRGGIKLLLPLSRRLLTVTSVGRSMAQATRLAREKDLEIGNAEFLSLLLGASILGGCVSWVLSTSVVFAIAAAGIIFIAAIMVINNRVEKCDLAMREAVPDALRSMATCFRSGQSLVQTIRHVSKEVDSPLGKIFGIAADRLDMGGTSAEALAVMQSNSGIPELSFIAIALDIQHQSGGSIAPVLESARDSVESELELMRSLRIQTAQAKLSARIVTIMPFVLVFLFSLISPDFLAPFFGSILGMALLGLALIMQVAGILMVRHMLKVEV